MKLRMDKVLKVPYKCCCFSARSAQGWIKDGGKIGRRGSLLQRTSSSDLKVTATNGMHSNDLKESGKKCCYFLFNLEVNFWRVFDVFLDLVILLYFNAISIEFYAVKSYVWEKRIQWTFKCLNFLNAFYNCIKVEMGECTSARICMGTHSQPLLQNRLMDIYQTW